MKKIIIYYDNYCPNCTRFSKIIKKLDWFKLIDLKELRNDHHTSEAVSKGIYLNMAHKQMASYDNQNWLYGYNTIYSIFKRILLFWIFVPFLWILKKIGIGNYVYIQISIKRKIIPLTCSNDSCQIPDN